MRTIITKEMLKQLLEVLFPMGYGSGLTRAENELEKWYIGFFAGDITIPMEVYVNDDTLHIQLARPNDGEFKPEELVGYVVGILSVKNPKLQFNGVGKDYWLDFYYNKED